MKVGDLVRFHKCRVAGTTGVIVGAPEPFFVNRPHLHTYLVAVSAQLGEVQCFTGSQLEVISESR